ncbi:hypothetical protein HYSC106933_08970 [Hydrogenibacillus schlegelii]
MHPNVIAAFSANAVSLTLALFVLAWLRSRRVSLGVGFTRVLESISVCRPNFKARDPDVGASPA